MSKSKLTISSNGTKEWRNEQGFFHREDGPAYEQAAGIKFWYIHGQLHREDGPAVEYINGHKEWWVNGFRHREDGPAVEYYDGSKQWMVNDTLHRLDGPAIEYDDDDGLKSWYIDGQKIEEENFPEAVIMFFLKCNNEAAEIILREFQK
jgi:hypothetical protein